MGNTLLKMGNPLGRMKKVDIAYLAGTIDSDGCISIQKYNNCNSYRSYLTVIQRDLPLIEYLYSTFGGSVNVVSTKRGLGRDFYFRWLVADSRAIKIFKMCLPYLKLKKQQAFLAIELTKVKTKKYRTGRYSSYTEQSIKLQKSIYDSIRSINSPATTERVGSKEMRQSELTEMKNRQSAIRSEAPLSAN
jgi:hypothetical protein